MRKLDSNGKPEPLQESEKVEILGVHLPYRIDLLKDAIDRIPAQTMADDQAFEAGAVAGRSLLSFLGVRYDRRVRKLAPDQKYPIEQDNVTDEVKVTDVGGQFVEVDELSEDQKVVLSRSFVASTRPALTLLGIHSILSTRRITRRQRR
jgi:hypothetical protein